MYIYIFSWLKIKRKGNFLLGNLLIIQNQTNKDNMANCLAYIKRPSDFENHFHPENLHLEVYVYIHVHVHVGLLVNCILLKYIVLFFPRKTTVSKKTTESKSKIFWLVNIRPGLIKTCKVCWPCSVIVWPTCTAYPYKEKRLNPDLDSKMQALQSMSHLLSPCNLAFPVQRSLRH